MRRAAAGSLGRDECTPTTYRQPRYRTRTDHRRRRRGDGRTQQTDSCTCSCKLFPKMGNGSGFPSSKIPLCASSRPARCVSECDSHWYCRGLHYLLLERYTQAQPYAYSTQHTISLRAHTTTRTIMLMFHRLSPLPLRAKTRTVSLPPPVPPVPPLPPLSVRGDG